MAQSPLSELFSSDGLVADLVKAHESAAVFDLSHWAHTWHPTMPEEFESAVTRDVDSLAESSCTEALILNEDGTLAEHVDLWIDEGVFTYHHRPASEPGSHAIFAVVGPKAGSTIGAVLGDMPTTGEVFRADWNGLPVLAAGNGPRYGTSVTLATPAEVGAEVLRSVLAEGGEVAGNEAFTALRTQAGELDWGSDGLPALSPMEADLTHLIDPEARFSGRRAYRRALRRGNQRAVVGFIARTCRPEVGSQLRAGDSLGTVVAVMQNPATEHPVGMGWLDPAPVFHRGSKAFGDPLPQLEVSVDGTWCAVSLSDPPFNR